MLYIKKGLPGALRFVEGRYTVITVYGSLSSLGYLQSPSPFHTVPDSGFLNNRLSK